MRTSSDFGNASGRPCAIPESFIPTTEPTTAACYQVIPKGFTPLQNRTRSSCIHPTCFQHYIACSHTFAGMDDSTDDNSCLSRWDSNDNEEYAALWPSPPMTPIKEDDMHPPQLTVCGLYPSQGWHVNSIGTTHYHQILVCDPSSDKNVIAPFISYAINQSRPTISGTYGQGYPIKTRPLTALGVNYATDTITTEQQALFYSNVPFASAIDHIQLKLS